MRAVIRPSVISGKIDAPQSKSLAIRLLFASLLGRIELHDLKMSDDVASALRALEAMRVETPETGVWSRSAMPAGLGDLYVGGSGTVLRVLLPILACTGTSGRIDGDETLRKRPLRVLREWFVNHGVEMSDDHLPLSISGRIDTSSVEISGSESSQYITGFIYGLLLTGGGRITLIPPVRSVSYLRMTCGVLNSLGCRVDFSGNEIRVEPPEKPVRYTGRVPGDFLLASFYAAAAMLTNGRVEIGNLSRREWSGTDSRIVDIFERAGAESSYINSTWVVSQEAETRPFTEDILDTPDMAVSLAALAACSTGVSKISGTDLLSSKESDRISSISQTLESFGCTVSHEHGISVKGPEKMVSATASAWKDHRIAMLGTVLSLVSGGVVEGAEAVNKSNPEFFEDLIRLGGDITLE